VIKARNCRDRDTWSSLYSCWHGRWGYTARYHDNSSTDISSTTLRLQTFRLQIFCLLWLSLLK